ncbi:kelch domain-containing protein [Anaeramoeba ignava]|uniref:Kelch domain-containing protein n=1 Tax=Anaeramoeba ignava TaxID=1746090 RepID=A0A9Q0RD36_ANAIG|nr:kelch domain-containing protein [Anaeramoeba ignava]
MTHELYSWQKIEFKGKTPGGRAKPSCVIYNNNLWVFGGFFSSAPDFWNDMWTLNLQTLEWTKRKQLGVQPNTRWGNTTVLFQGRMYIYGGLNKESGRLADREDMYFYDLESEEWQAVEYRKSSEDEQIKIPQPRDYHTAVVYKNAMVVFAGWKYRFFGSTYFNDLWIFDFAKQTWKEITSEDSSPWPQARTSHTAVISQDKMFIFGGQTRAKDLNDLWCFDLRTNKWLEINTLGDIH